MGVQADQIGAQYDIISRALSARFYELNQRPFLAQGDVNSWITGYNQLVYFAHNYGNNSYVAKQWRSEEPQYSNVVRTLQAKVRASTNQITIPDRFTPNPANYDARISISGNGTGGVGGCGCGGKDSSIDTSGDVSRIPARAATQIVYNGAGGINSLGDIFRDLFSTKPIPSIQGDYPESKLVDGLSIVSGIITAIVVAGILYIVHRATKGN